jgi:hypothetical protein
MVIAALVVAIVSALAAVAAVVYARRLDRAVKQAVAAARRSAVASEERSRLETGRRHDELTPRFRVSVKGAGMETFGIENLLLTVFLAGPAALGVLDGLTVMIRNDHLWRGKVSRVAGGATDEQVAAHIWGPYRFTRSSGQGGQAGDSTGRTMVTDGVPVGESLEFSLSRPRSRGRGGLRITGRARGGRFCGFSWSAGGRAGIRGRSRARSILPGARSLSISRSSVL